ncbi:MAG: DUF1592 domain-containing protein, partial [Rubripirellula sp.]
MNECRFFLAIPSVANVWFRGLACLLMASASLAITAGDEPAGDEPAGDEPAGGQPAAVEPTAVESAAVEPLAATAAATHDASDADSFEQTVRPFLRNYCAECHSADEQKGDRRFDRLASTIDSDDTLVDYQDILDQLNLSEMPPEDASQPSDAERQRIIAWLTSRLNQYHAIRRSSGGTVLRRLNAREYRNTVRDLLDLNMTMFDPTTKFPRDQTTDHLDNVGETLVTSGHLLARYLDAADQVVRKALSPKAQPEIQEWRFHDNFHQQPEIDQVHRKTNRYEYMTLYDVVGADKPEGAYGPIHDFAEGVPYDGWYEIRLLAEAVNRKHPYDQQFLKTDRSEPLRLGIVAGNQEVGSLHLPQPVEPLLAEIDLADEAAWYTVKVWLDAGYTPRFTFRNGLMDARGLWSRVIKTYRDQFPANIAKGIVAARFNAIKHGKLPQIHIDEIEIRGPIYDQWPTRGREILLGDAIESSQEGLDSKVMGELIQSFASRAYRRPARKEEVERILQVVDARRMAGRSEMEAFADGLKAVLCSPNFLYLDESVEAEDSNLLSSYALASRLSYFLWSSMPDDELISLAASGELHEPGVLDAQVDRMLADPKSDALVDGFLGSWLGLRELGATPPDRSEFRDFYQYDLDSAMRQETFLFTRHMIDEDLPLAKFVDSEFSFVNKPLARFYGLKNVPGGTEFEKVTISDRRRGGLLGQASVLTLTANGIDTSPVVRGVWLLENLLGTPPSPPPPDVEPLDPDVRGAKTIRDQLDKHRDVASCYDCHRKIDPLGFALENFDPIGRWRDSYGRNTKIDASGELPGGRTFEDVVGLKDVLLDQQPIVA